MPTLSLSSRKLNRMPGLLRETCRAVLDYKEELSALGHRTLQISRVVLVYKCGQEKLNNLSY